MAKKETASQTAPLLPMLKTVEQMSKVSGIGENKLRELMDSGELEYIQNGNRRLIADATLQFGIGTTGQRDRQSPRQHKGVKVWLYHQDKYRISAIATAF